MKKFLVIFLYLLAFKFQAQVGIGTANVPESALLYLSSVNQGFVPPRMTGDEMQEIISPLNGAVVYNTSKQGLYVFTQDKWTPISYKTFPALLLERSFEANQMMLNVRNNAHNNAPFNLSSVKQTSATLYQVSSNGKVKIQETGTYMLNGAISINNLPSGNRKYVLITKVNNVAVGYLSRGASDTPVASDWTTSGTLLLTLKQGDIVELNYTFNDVPYNVASIKSINFNLIKLI